MDKTIEMLSSHTIMCQQTEYLFKVTTIGKNDFYKVVWWRQLNGTRPWEIKTFQVTEKETVNFGDWYNDYTVPTIHRSHEILSNNIDNSLKNGSTINKVQD